MKCLRSALCAALCLMVPVCGTAAQDAARLQETPAAPEAAGREAATPAAPEAAGREAAAPAAPGAASGAAYGQVPETKEGMRALLERLVPRANSQIAAANEEVRNRLVLADTNLTDEDLDRAPWLERLELVGDALRYVYRYRLFAAGEAQKLGQQEAIGTQLREKYCASMKQFMDRGFVFLHVYVDRDGQEVFSIPLNTETCSR